MNLSENGAERNEKALKYKPMHSCDIAATVNLSGGSVIDNNVNIPNNESYVVNVRIVRMRSEPDLDRRAKRSVHSYIHHVVWTFPIIYLNMYTYVRSTVMRIPCNQLREGITEAK